VKPPLRKRTRRLPCRSLFQQQCLGSPLFVRSIGQYLIPGFCSDPSSTEESTLAVTTTIFPVQSISYLYTGNPAFCAAFSARVTSASVNMARPRDIIRYELLEGFS
jgi:hypothetical protein